jgi:hypothetical protein
MAPARLAGFGIGIAPGDFIAVRYESCERVMRPMKVTDDNE